jgi:predicted TIM-barrel fold metal-dependent hydrolase
VTDTLEPDHRYTVVSADAHAGADIADYRPYLSAAWHDEFDAWAASYVNPFADLLAPTAYRSWDSDRRLAENDADGITAEVLFPNTVPPFFEEASLVALPPTESEYDRRWAGIQAHNRWLADFCARVPGRRAGVAQIFANRIDDALAEVRWAAEAFSPFGGILLPSLPARIRSSPLWDPAYEPLWGLCEELDVVVNIHGGGGLPDYGDAEVARAIMLIEIAVVLPPFGLAPHLRRRPRAPPVIACGADRAGSGLGAPGAGDPRLVLRSDDSRRRGRGQLLRRRGQGDVHDADRVLPTQRLGRGQLPTGQRIRPPPRGGRGADHVGRRLPPFGGQLSLQPGSAAGRLRLLRPNQRPDRWSRSTRPIVTGSTSTPSGSSAKRSDRRWPRWPPRSLSTSTPPARPATPSTATRCSGPGRPIAYGSRCRWTVGSDRGL